jgi:voltage-gated sodium channel
VTKLLYKIFLNEWIVVTAILGNSIALFLLGFQEFKEVGLIYQIDHFFTIFFIIEVVVKVQAMGWKTYIGDGGNKFDFILVAISLPSVFEMFVDIPDMSYLLVFRLLRVLRILRFMRFIPNIRSMLAGIQRAFRASAFVFAALLIYNVLLAILSTYLFHVEDPAHFGDPFRSLYSIFQIFTLEGWNEIPEIIEANSEPGSWKSGFARLFFLLVVLTGGIFGFSIVNAIFVDEMVMDNNDALEAKVDELNAKIDRLLEERNE